MTDLESPVQTPEVQDDQILKQKKPRKEFSPEVRAKMSENMKRINAERLAKARIRSEDSLNQKQEDILSKAQKKLDSVEQKKAKITQIKQERGIPVLAKAPPPPPPPPLPPPPKKKSKKQILVELSSDSDGETDSESSDDEVIYVSKKKANQPRNQSDRKNNSIVKPKQNRQPETMQHKIPDPPKTVIKFI